MLPTLEVIIGSVHSIQRLQKFVELQLKHRITRFRCDNGKGEYDNEAF